MAENAANAANAGTAAKKEKKTLDYRIAFALMVIMILCSLCIGANKAWKNNRSGVSAGYAAWRENVQQRVETAYNLMTVAGRYLPADDQQLTAIKNDLDAMAATQETDETDTRRAAACEQFIADGNALLKTLAANAAVQSDARDNMYATLMLPQALEQCSNNSALTAYNEAARTYNDGMHSFSGLLARLTGVGYAPIFETTTVSASAE